MKFKNIVIIIVSYLILTSYFTSNRQAPTQNSEKSSPRSWRSLTLNEKLQIREKLTSTARSYLNKKGFDCSGLILQIFKQNKVILFSEQAIHQPGANGVKIIYDTLKRYKKIFPAVSRVKKGDLVFFNNTYDRNRNRRLDDSLTHIGMIVEVQNNGTVKFIHSTGSGIKIDSMNLRDKNNKELNSYLRIKSSRDSYGTKYLTGELFYCFGTIF